MDKPATVKRPMAEANRLTQMLDLVRGQDRFPVDVQELALEYSNQCFASERIAKIVAMDIPGFEGILKARSDGQWAIGYNSEQSSGRVRFTLAHEFGHYMLHRQLQSSFKCTSKDVYDWESMERKIETDADLFASYLLMPLNDFRQQVQDHAGQIEMLRHCADRYGVSIMAAALKWIEIAPKRAVVVVVRDGFVHWARSNTAARKSGLVLAAKKNLIEVPEGSLLARSDESASGLIQMKSARLWFPKEPQDMELVEHIHVVEGGWPYTLGLLLLPDAIPLWERRDEDDDEGLAPLSHPTRWR
ncbi:ImmA/IrrE family metallo-endopeptidase [Xanthomonas euvesicatoria]|uniref:ImmA/IrrE family metallo-endopeptidase n=1 Tax=Xanthomonas euvesicatoria TaxID=456327 RepID=UPI00053B0A3F|nr:ImmA/IrrE family metallo-endopeptidase [Xanthomonas euvesicatoria]QTK46640.1 ImmA/IrrE family metallo-endopeptidase [Xanthomonas euvesicatoria pv. alfalfae]